MGLVISNPISFIVFVHRCALSNINPKHLGAILSGFFFVSCVLWSAKASGRQSAGRPAEGVSFICSHLHRKDGKTGRIPSSTLSRRHPSTTILDNGALCHCCRVTNSQAEWSDCTMRLGASSIRAERPGILTVCERVGGYGGAARRSGIGTRSPRRRRRRFLAPLLWNCSRGESPRGDHSAWTMTIPSWGISGEGARLT